MNRIPKTGWIVLATVLAAYFGPRIEGLPLTNGDPAVSDVLVARAAARIALFAAVSTSLAVLALMKFRFTTRFLLEIGFAACVLAFLYSKYISAYNGA